MAQATSVTRKTTITSSGTYAGTSGNNEKVLFGSTGMTVLLYDIDRVVGSSGNDLVYFGRTDPERHANVNLGAGDDRLCLAGGQEHVVKLKGVETIVAEPGASLSVVGSASFATDGSFDISRAAGGGKLEISFYGISDDIALTPGSGQHVFAFDPAFRFKVDGVGRLVVAQDGHELAFLAVDPHNEAITIVVGEDSYTYAEMYRLALANSGPEVTSITNDHPGGVISDDDRVVTYSVAFSEAVAGVTPGDLHIEGGVLVAGPDLAQDGLSVTFSVEAPLGSASDLFVHLAGTIMGVGGHALEPAYDDSVSVDLAPPVFYGLSGSVLSRATNADSVVFRGQFSKPVAQVGADDFVLTGTTATITSIELAQGSSFTDLTITVSGGDLAGLTGNVIFSFAPDQDIVDLQGRPLVDQNLDLAITTKFDNTPPAVTVTDVGSIAWLQMGPGFWIEGAGINDPDTLDPWAFDWSKLRINVDDGGPDITFTSDDVYDAVYSSGAVGILLTAQKAGEIDARVDGIGDQFVIAEGFWVDPAGNVQTVGGNFITAADMF